VTKKRETASSPDDFLTVLWRELRDDVRPHRKNYVLGALDAMNEFGVIDDTRLELWQRRIETCPGHDDEGGRAWCAYCGPMQQAKEG